MQVSLHTFFRSAIFLLAAAALQVTPAAAVFAAHSAEHADSAQSGGDFAESFGGGVVEQFREFLADFAQPQFLEVDAAFQLRVSAVTGDAADSGGFAQLQGAFSVADGYYLYRDKIEFTAAGAPLEVTLPPGEIISDQYFGEMAVYKRDFHARIALPNPPAAAELQVRAKYQGCAEDGICYAPVEENFRVRLPPLIPTAHADTAPPTSAGIGSNAANFAAVTATGDESAKPAVPTSAGIGSNAANFAAATATGDESAKTAIPTSAGIGSNTANSAAATATGDESAKTAIPTSAGIGSNAANSAAVAVTGNSAAALPAPLAALLSRPRGVLPAAFLAGILLSMTPCVLPMLPILSGAIAAGGVVTRRRGGLLALIYAGGVTCAYALIGAVAGAGGGQLQAYFQNAWVIGGVAALLAAMALAMFGVFKLELPAAWQTAFHARTRNLRGAAPAVFALGVVSALVVGACVSPVLIAFLGLAIAAGDAALGAKMMTAMALGMGVPLVLFGVGLGHWLPRAGKWSAGVNRAFGVLLLALAIYLLGALPAVPVLWLWAGFLLALGMYLLRAPFAAALLRGGARAAGVGLLLWGAAAAGGAANGGRDVLRPFPPAEIGGAHAALFTRIAGAAEFDAELTRASAAGKAVLLDYYADWCVDCIRMEKTTFRDARVREFLRENFVLLQVDLTDARAPGGKALKKRFGVYGPPAVLLFGRDGVEVTAKRFYGYRDAGDFYALISSI